jgi:hypothetical protein
VMEDPTIASDLDREPPHIPPALLRKLIPTLEEATDLVGEGALDPTGSRFFYKKHHKPKPSYLDKLMRDVDDRRSKSFKMSEYVGHHAVDDESRLFFDLKKLHEPMHVSRIVGYVQQSRVVGLELQYRGSYAPQVYGETTGISTAQDIPEGGSIMAVVLQSAPSRSLRTEVVFSVSILTSVGDKFDVSAQDAEDIDKSKPDVYHSRAPDGPWSLKGFWGQKLDKTIAPAGGFDRLGVFWGRDEVSQHAKAQVAKGTGKAKRARPAAASQPAPPPAVPPAEPPLAPVPVAEGNDGGDSPGALTPTGDEIGG